MPQDTKAQLCLSTEDFPADLAFFSQTLGFALDMIFPADNPRLAVLSGHGLRLRLKSGDPTPPVTIRLEVPDPAAFAGTDGPAGKDLRAPNGTKIQLAPLAPALDIPQTHHEFALRRLADEAPWVIGRAGMNYRDLVPSRLGGAIIASHIRIPGGGAVPDMVHYHSVGFQLIYCIGGWVDVLYEDQGDDMLRLHPGDCVIQPPAIRHRVCHASADLEVIEIGVPAEHVTTIDHTMQLPNGRGDPAREWQGQRFVHHVRKKARWRPFRIPGFTCRDTGINAGTKGVASVEVARFQGGSVPPTCHEGDIVFNFVTEGAMALRAENGATHRLSAGDAFVIPPGMVTQYVDCTDDLELLEVALPGAFETRLLET